MSPEEGAARQVCARLRAAGYRALFAGGCVRDGLLGRVPKDYDVATSARPADVQSLFPDTHAVGASFGVVLVKVDGVATEVATFRSDGEYHDGRRPSTVRFVAEEEDARRRDFTINALFYDPEAEDVLDYVGGTDDLRAGVVRTVGEAARRFEEDHLRLLRAIRFAARLDFNIEADTWAAIRAMAGTIGRISAERIRDELVMILTEGGARRGLELLEASGLLGEILPEVAAMRGVEQPPRFHPEGDVWTHTLLVLDQLEAPTAALAMGALLHDVGKPCTQTFKDRIRFNLHDKAGARLSEAICRRLRFANRDAARIAWLVENHMRLAHLPNMRESKRRRLVAGEGFDELLALGRADCLGSHRDLTTVEWIEDYRARLGEETPLPPPLISGDDLIGWGYTPGPRFSEMLRTVQDAYLDGQIAGREAAEAFVRDHWPLDRSSG